MKKPISAGDVCRVVGGMGRAKSPNLGLVVTVGMRMYGGLGMDHSQWGPVHRCSGEGVMQMTDAGGYMQTNEADFPLIWLEPIEPPVLPPESTATTRVLETH